MALLVPGRELAVKEMMLGPFAWSLEKQDSFCYVWSQDIVTVNSVMVALTTWWINKECENE